MYRKIFYSEGGAGGSPGAAAPASGPTPAAAPSPAAGAPTATPGTQQAAPPPAGMDYAGHLNTHWFGAEPGEYAPKDPNAPLTHAELLAANTHNENRKAVLKFRSDMTSFLQKPGTLGGDLNLPIAFTDQASVDAYMGTVKKLANGNITPQQAAMIHNFDGLVQAAYERGSRDFEQKLASGKANAAPGGQGAGAPVVPAPTDKAAPQGKLPGPAIKSIKDMMKERDPKGHDAIQAGTFRFGQ